MRNPTFLKLAIGVVVILTVAGVGYAGLMVWRDPPEVETQVEDLLNEDKPREEEKLSKADSCGDPNPSELDVSCWKSYQNGELGFHVRYPSKFAMVPAVQNFPFDFSMEFPSSKLIFADRVANLGKKECAYGEAGGKLVCSAEAEDGLSFTVIHKPFEDAVRQSFAEGEYFEDIEVGGRKGKRYPTGVEGYGFDYIFVPYNSDSTLIIVRKHFNDTPNYEIALIDRIAASANLEQSEASRWLSKVC